MTATDELHRMLNERGVEWKEHRHTVPGSMAIQRETLWGQPIDNTTGKPIPHVYHSRATEMGDGRLFLEAQLVTPAQAIAATVGRDDRESYDAGFASGVKATLQQLYGLLHEYPTLDEIEAWADSQWEVDE